MHDELKQRAFRFIFTGIVITAIHTIIAFVGISCFFWTPPIGNGVAFICATILSYIINTKWSFSSKVYGKNLARYIIVSFCGLFFSISISYLVQRAGGGPLMGIAVVALLIPPFTFLLHTFWTYRR